MLETAVNSQVIRMYTANPSLSRIAPGGVQLNILRSKWANKMSLFESKYVHNTRLNIN